MTNTPAIQEIHLYFIDPNGPFPVKIPYDEIQNGVTLSTGEQFLIEIDQNNDHYIRIINLFNNFQSTKFGSILGIKYVYDDGSVGWIKRIVSSGHGESTAIQYGERLDIAIGNWVEGKTLNEAMASPQYTGRPYIGYVESWVVYEIERVVPEPEPDPEPEPEPDPQPDPYPTPTPDPEPEPEPTPNPEPEEQPEDELTLYDIKPYIPNYPLPNIVKRNARYRGPRESEKYLHSHQEQIYEIRQNWKVINDFTELQQQTIQSFFEGESEKPKKNIMISNTKTFQIENNINEYVLLPHIVVRKINHIMVKLDGNEISNTSYQVVENRLQIDSSILTNHKEITVSFVAEVEVAEDHIFGLEPIKSKLQYLDKKLGELERRYQTYENAYQ
jgi:hypothetical protein